MRCGMLDLQHAGLKNLSAEEFWMAEMARRSESTKKRYRMFLDKFCEFVGAGPDEIIETRRKDLESSDPQARRRFEILLKQFINYLEAEGYSVSSLQVAYAAIRSFFETHYMQLMMRRGDYPSGEGIGQRAATKEVLQKMYERADARGRALILCLKDSGLRVSDLAKLRVGYVKKHLGAGEEYVPIRIVTKKKRIVARTFFGPEALEALKEYLERREKGTRHVEPEKLTDSSPLFVTKRKQPLTRSGLSSLITQLAQRVGLERISAHSLRKFFQTQLEAAGVHPNWIEQMMGHKLEGVRGAYSMPTDQQLREAYVKAYYSLRIFPIKVPNEEINVLMRRLHESQERILMLERERVQLRERIMQLENLTRELEEERKLRLEYEKRLDRVERLLEKFMKLQELEAEEGKRRSHR